MEEPFLVNKTKRELSTPGIKELFFKYIRFLPLFVLSIALALLVAYTYLRYATPIYQSAGSLIIKDEGGKGKDKLDELMAAEGEINIQNEIEQIKSLPLMERVVKGLNLNFSYYSKGKVNELDIYKTAPFRIEALALNDSSNSFTLNLHFESPNRFRLNTEKELLSFNQAFKNADGIFRLVKTEGTPVGDYIVIWKPNRTVAYQLSSNLLVVPRGATKILNLSLQATHPKLAADVINRLMLEYRLASVEEKNETINQQLAFINGRLEVVEDELAEIGNRLLAYQRANNLINFESQSTEYFTRIGESDKLLSEQQTQAELVQMIDAYLRNSRNNYSTTPSTLGLADPTLNTLIAAYNVAQLERKGLLDKNIPASNPLLQAKEEQIEKLRQNILENLRVIRGSYAASIQNLRKENAAAQSQIRLLPEKQQRLLEMQREYETKQAVYNILLEQKERSSITLAATTSNVRIVDEASPNLTPVKPNRRNVQLMAIFIGLALPALAIFIIEALNDKVSSRVDIERITDATILGEVGHSYNKEALVVTPYNRGVIAEQFRIIRSNLQYVINNISNPVILVTSSFSGEGKSFISTNIGAVMALAGKKTIILEFDIRKPKVLTHLNMPKKPGLTNYLLGKADLEQLPVLVPNYENLYVLACGPIPPNPAEILLDARMETLFQFLKSQFDVIIMDTAPIGMVSDALTLSKFADSSLYIVRQGHTFKKQIGMVDEFYRQGKLPKLSVILNDVKRKAGYGYGYGYGYGNGYGYDSGYFDDEKDIQPNLIKTWLGWVGINGKHQNKKSKKEKL